MVVADQPVPSTADDLSTPDEAALVKAGGETLERMSRESCSWRAIIDLDAGPRVEVQVLDTPQARCTTVGVINGGMSQEVYRIIDRDGLHYVKELGKPLGKFRPYEAPLCSPAFQLYLELAQPLFLAEETLRGATHERTSGSVASYRVPVPENAAREFRGMVQSLEQVRKRAAAEPNYRPNAKIQQQLALAKDILARGRPVDIDTRLGIIRRMVFPGKWTITLEGPQFRSISPESFRVEGTRWEDQSSDPTDGVDSKDLVMIGNDGVWQPGKRVVDTECRLMNVRTGRYRRVPFEGAECVPACFLRGRTSVAVLGMEPLKGTVLGLFEVNLKTGENKRLGGDLLADRICLGAALSPDGNTLAAIVDKGILVSEVCLIDLQTNRARALGRSRTMTLSWLPDGKQLVLGDSIDHGPGQKPRLVVCRMDLQGKLSIIRDGEDPLLLGDGETILFRHADGNWQTCDLEGRDVKPYAQGMPEAKHPTLCPDGERILWMCPEQGRLVPRVGKVGSPKLSLITNASGYWDRPQWR